MDEVGGLSVGGGDKMEVAVKESGRTSLVGAGENVSSSQAHMDRREASSADFLIWQVSCLAPFMAFSAAINALPRAFCDAID